MPEMGKEEQQLIAKRSEVKRLVEYFEEAESSTDDARKLSERDRDYYDNKQWTDDEVSIMKRRKQPVVTYNRIARKINFLSGLEKQTRKDPKAFPRNPSDEKAANAATDAIRYVCDKEDWDDKRSAAWDNILIEGTCAIMVGVKQGRDGYNPSLTRIPWDRYFFDPKSSEADFSDKRYDGIVTWYDLDVALAQWPDKGDVLAATLAGELETQTFGDKPRTKMWATAGAAKRVRVIEMYHKEGGVWQRSVFTKGGYLEDQQPSPYLDEEGQPENPIKAISLYVDRDNNRYGSVRVMISPQDEINKRRSKGLHLITMRQARVAPSSMQDAEKVRRELAKPDGIIVGEKDDFEILLTNDMARGNFEMLQDAKAEIDLLGANSALAGKNENDMSGRAILAQQQGGMTEVAREFDRLRCLSIEVYRAIWNRIRQVWTDERWIRVTEDERNMRFVGLNQQVTVKMIAEGVGQQNPEDLEAAVKLVGPQIMQAYMQGDPQAQMQLGLFVQQYGNEVVEVRNPINELDVDIVIDEGMDTPTVQAEQFEMISKILPGIVNLPPAYAKMLIQASSLRDKDAMLETLEQMMAAPQPDPFAEQMKQITVAAEAAKVEETQSKTVKNYAQAQTAGGQPPDPEEKLFRAAEIEVDQYSAVTDRIQALQPDRPKEAA